jgi:hypothetical protein
MVSVIRVLEEEGERAEDKCVCAYLFVMPIKLFVLNLTE